MSQRRFRAGRAGAQRYLPGMTDETRVLYNQTCPICRAEISAYQRRALKEGLPIRFDPLERAEDWGLTEDEAARRLHVWHQGRVLSGLEAFRALWQALPHLRWLAWLTGLPLIRPAVAGVYDHALAPLLFWRHRRRQARAAARGD